MTVEVTFRPDRSMVPPDGCAWLQRALAPVDLRWDLPRLKHSLEDLVRRQLSRKAASPAGAARAQAARVWGVRAVDVVMPDGRRHAQLRDRECPWKVDMSWEKFVGDLPDEYKRTSADVGHPKKEFSFGLYLAYDFGVSIHRNLKGKPRALV